MHSAVVPGPFSIAVASSVAKGHYDTGIIRYQTFCELATPSLNSDPEWFQRVIEVGVSAVTNIALSLELQLKILHFQHSGKYPRGHNVAELGLQLPEATLGVLRNAYVQLRSDPTRPQLLTFNFRGGPTSEVPNGTWPGEAETYGEAVRLAADAHSRWRYIYEEFGSTLDVSMSFEHLILLVKTVDQAVKAFEGKAKITLEPPT